MENLGSHDDEREPLLAAEPKTLDQLIDAVSVAGAKKFSRWHPFKRAAAKKELRAAIDALKARWMRNGGPYDQRPRDSRDNSVEVKLLRSTLDVMEAHFTSQDIQDVLMFAQHAAAGNTIPLITFIRATDAENPDFEKNRPTIGKVIQKIDRELFQQLEFNIREDLTAEAVRKKINELLIRGLTLQSRDENGSTLLHKVLEQLNPGISDTELRKVFQFLQENGADFNAKDKRGNTPLHIAARRRLAVVNEGGVTGGAIKILCEEFGACPEIANNDLKVPSKYGQESNELEVAKLRKSNKFDEAIRNELEEYTLMKYISDDSRLSNLHVAIETREVARFRYLIQESRKSNAAYQQNLGHQHPKFGLPISHLEKLINDYENEKRIHSPREWYRQRKLKQMMAFYLRNLAEAIYVPYINNNHTLNVPLKVEIDALRLENKNKVFPSLGLDPNITEPVRQLYFAEVPAAPRGPAPVVAGSANNSNNVEAVALAPASAAQPVVTAQPKNPIVELREAFCAFNVRSQPAENLRNLLNQLNKLSQEFIADVLNGKNPKFFNRSVHSSLEHYCDFHRIKLWEYENIWQALLKITEESDKHANLQQAVSGKFTTQAVRLINDRKVYEHGVNKGLESELLRSAVTKHDVVVVELLLKQGAEVTFSEFRLLFDGENYREECKRVNEILQREFAKKQWSGKDIKMLLSDTYRSLQGYFNTWELQAILDGLSRLTPAERKSILNEEIKVGGFGGVPRTFRQCIEINCMQKKVAFPMEYSDVHVVQSGSNPNDNNNNVNVSASSLVLSSGASALEVKAEIKSESNSFVKDFYVAKVAIETEDVPELAALLERGLDVYARDDSGKHTVVELAERSRNPEIRKMVTQKPERFSEIRERLRKIIEQATYPNASRENYIKFCEEMDKQLNAIGPDAPSRQDSGNDEKIRFLLMLNFLFVPLYVPMKSPLEHESVLKMFSHYSIKFSRYSDRLLHFSRVLLVDCVNQARIYHAFTKRKWILAQQAEKGAAWDKKEEAKKTAEKAREVYTTMQAHMGVFQDAIIKPLAEMIRNNNDEEAIIAALRAAEEDGVNVVEPNTLTGKTLFYFAFTANKPKVIRWLLLSGALLDARVKVLWDDPKYKDSREVVEACYEELLGELRTILNVGFFEGKWNRTKISTEIPGVVYQRMAVLGPHELEKLSVSERIQLFSLYVHREEGVAKINTDDMEQFLQNGMGMYVLLEIILGVEGYSVENQTEMARYLLGEKVSAEAAAEFPHAIEKFIDRQNRAHSPKWILSDVVTQAMQECVAKRAVSAESSPASSRVAPQSAFHAPSSPRQSSVGQEPGVEQGHKKGPAQGQ